MEGDKYFLEPGYMLISNEPHLIHTVLGSCVSVCLWDIHGRAGGMNHYVLPRAKADDRRAYYGDVAIPHLIKAVKQYGIKTNELQAHIIGGGFNETLGSYIGESNAEIAKELLDRHKITIVTVDISGPSGRKVIFNNLTGEVVVYKNIAVRRTDWYNDRQKN